MSIVNLYRKDNQPFAQIPNEAIRDPRITPNAFRLLAYLMSHQDGYALTYDQIQRQTTLGRKAINNAAELLTTLGWIEVDRPKAQGQFQAKSWTILSPIDVVRNATVRDATVRQGQVARGTHLRTLPNKENKVNKKTTVKKLEIDFKTEFEQFWNAYPRHASRPKAFESFVKARTKTSLEFLITAALAYANDPNRDAGFTKIPATWLNQECWNDPPLPDRNVNQRQQQKSQARDQFMQATSPNQLQITDGDPF